jgi:hypothetical protein
MSSQNIEKLTRFPFRHISYFLPPPPDFAEEAIAKMFLHMTGAKRFTLQARPHNVFHSLTQCRSLSMVTNQEPYWQKLKPWSNVTTEEFKTYRWQV